MKAARLNPGARACYDGNTPEPERRDKTMTTTITLSAALALAAAYERIQAQKALRAYEARARKSIRIHGYDRTSLDRTAPTLAEHAARLANC